MNKSDSMKFYRAQQKKLLGEDEFKKGEALRKRQARAIKKAAKLEEEELGILLPEVRVPISDQKDRDKKEHCSMLFENVFAAKLKHAESIGRTIKKSSVLQQWTKMLNLYKKLENKQSSCADFDWLNNTKRVVAYVNSHWKTDNSRNSQFQALASILIAFSKYKTAYQYYSDLSTANRTTINNLASNSILTPNERSNIVHWNELKDLYDSDELSSRERAIVGIYTLTATRRVADVALLTLIDSESKESDELNYIVLEDNIPIKFVYNNYKTQSTYGRVEIDINDTLQTILIDYINDDELKMSNPLFPTESGGYYANFSQIVSSIFSRFTKKKSTSVNPIRHAYVSHFLETKKSLKEKRDLGRQMGHSVSTQSAYDRLDI